MSEPMSEFASQSQSLVLCEQVGAVARVTLNRPSARNALSGALCGELLATLGTMHAMAEAGEVRVATLQGAGAAFSAGADLKERAAMDPEAMAAHSQIIATCAERLAALACPVIACINGAALGGGLELALACDLRVVAADATLGFPELAYGFFPGAGGPVRLVRLVGLSTATYLIMSTARISGEGAVRLASRQRARPAARRGSRRSRAGAKDRVVSRQGCRRLARAARQPRRRTVRRQHGARPHHARTAQ